VPSAWRCNATRRGIAALQTRSLSTSSAENASQGLRTVDDRPTVHGSAGGTGDPSDTLDQLAEWLNTGLSSQYIAQSLEHSRQIRAVIQAGNDEDAERIAANLESLAMGAADDETAWLEYERAVESFTRIAEREWKRIQQTHNLATAEQVRSLIAPLIELVVNHVDIEGRAARRLMHHPGNATLAASASWRLDSLATRTSFETTVEFSDARLASTTVTTDIYYPERCAASAVSSCRTGNSGVD